MARVPLYKATETELVRRIRSGEWEVGRRLPNEFVLAEEFGVSQGTMRRALMSLEGMGLLSRKPGRGTLVSAPGAVPPKGDAESMALRDNDGSGVDLEVFRARARTRSATPEEADLFGTARLVALERTLRRNGERVALDEVVLPEAVLPALDEDAPPDLGDILANTNHPWCRIDDHLSADITTMGESVALSCDRNTALLVLVRIARDDEAQAIARQHLRIIADGLSYGPA